MKIIIISILIIIPLLAQAETYYQSGDLIIVGIKEVNHVAGTTNSGFFHSAIISVEDSIVSVIHATADYGVVKIKFEEFLDLYPIMIIRRHSDKKLSANAAAVALNQVNKPWNGTYCTKKGSFFCSDLVAYSYNEANLQTTQKKEGIFKYKVLNLEEDYWQKLKRMTEVRGDIFPEYGRSISPQDIANSPYFRTIKESKTMCSTILRKLL